MARTRAADYEDKQRAILRTAAAVFARDGMDKASMAVIAREGGISKPLLYHYYDSKNALVFAIIHTHLSELDAVVTEADAPDLSPEDRLRQLIAATLENYRDADDFHKVQLTSAGMLSEEQLGEIHAIERRIVRRFADVLAALNPDLTEGRRLLVPVTMSLFGILTGSTPGSAPTARCRAKITATWPPRSSSRACGR